jgi:hypothetical protein
MYNPTLDKGLYIQPSLLLPLLPDEKNSLANLSLWREWYASILAFALRMLSINSLSTKEYALSISS